MQPQGVNADFDFSGVVHVKGIPYSTSEVELEGFFRECRVSKVIIMRRPGKVLLAWRGVGKSSSRRGD